MADIIIQDVCEMTVTDKITGKPVFFGNTTASGISQSINEEKLRAGIGNGVKFVLRSDKEIDVAMTTLPFNKEQLAMTQGVEVKDGDLEITKVATLPVIEDSATGDLSVDLNKANPDDGHNPTVIAALTEAKLEDKDGDVQSVAITSGIVSVPTGSGVAIGDDVVIFYKETVTGSVLDFRADKFSTKYEIQLYTIAYDMETQDVISDIYIKFDEAVPSGEFSLDFATGEVINPEINFSVVLPKNSKKMGTFIEVPRKK